MEPDRTPQSLRVPPYLGKTRAEMIRDLQWHWEGAYTIQWSARAKMIIARRTDNGREFWAQDPRTLREMIMDDYSAHPVPRSSTGE